MPFKVFQVRGTSDKADYYRTFNWKNLRDLYLFTEGMNSSEAVRIEGEHYLHWPDKTIVYRAGKSNLVLDLYSPLPIPELTIDGENNKGIQETVKFLTTLFPQVRIDEKRGERL